ncbi:MAG: ribonuclease D, partial [Candidatus Hodarchaeales archaeon]
ININKKSKLVEIIAWTRKKSDVKAIERRLRDFFDERGYTGYTLENVIKGNLPAPEYITDSKQLEQAVKQILKYDTVSVDIEADGRFSYVEKLCLVQLATVEKAYIIDVLMNDDNSLLRDIFENRNIQKIFHDGRWDIELIKRDLKINVLNVFDTSAAYRVIGNIHHTSLDKLIHNYFDVSLDKKLQKANWGKRPLTNEMLIYGQLDVHFLIPLKEKLLKEIVSMDRLYLIEDYCSFLESVTPTEAKFNPNSFWRVKGMQKLSPQQQAVLKELYLWRESVAKARNKPPYMIMSNDLLIEISKNCPSNKEELLGIYHAKEYLVNKYGKKIINCVKKGLESEAPVFPEDNIIKRYPQVKNDLKVNKLFFVKISEWRRKTASRLGIDPELVLPKDSVLKLAFLIEKGEIHPLPGFSEEKIRRYRKELMRLLGKPVKVS